LNDPVAMHEAVVDFIEQMGLVYEGSGLSRIAGRIIGYLLADEGLHSLDDIAERLGVSKGSVSTNARHLEQVGIIERKSIPGDRRDYYRIGENPWESLHLMIRRRLNRTIGALETGLERIPAELEQTRRRILAWHRFHRFMVQDFERTSERWERWKEENPAPAAP
jgi:DNA-binding transcriptional regulator GbsR (MarR family)